MKVHSLFGISIVNTLVLLTSNALYGGVLLVLSTSQKVPITSLRLVL